MGVPGFFLWLWKNYKNSNFVFRKEKLLIANYDRIPKDKIDFYVKQNIEIAKILKEVNNIDYFLIDTNCLIHPMCFKILAEHGNITNTDELEKKMIEKVLEYIDELITYVNPKKGIYIAIDGVAPIAKIKQQRSRRFKSVHDKELFDKIKIKYDKPVSHTWNNSAITPGTVFMEKLHYNILEWCKKQTLEIIYSSCNTPAEGEHKLLQFIRNNQQSNKEFGYLLYGLDADLIFLALSTNTNNIYLLREANQMNKNEPEGALNYVSIEIMKQCIIETMNNYYQKNLLEYVKVKLDNDKLINDFVFLCYFLGNDFLPHLPSLDIHKNGIDYLVECYMLVFFELQDDKNNYLIESVKKNNIKINNEFLLKLVEKLGEKEEDILKTNFNTKRHMRCNSTDDYEKELFKIDNLQFKIHDPILLGSDNLINWRKRYYKHYFGCTTDESIEIFSKKLVYNYLMGIKWVSQYYFDTCPSWDWYYPYDYPPFLSDIHKYLTNINEIKFKLGKPLKPFMQLLCVLPPQSSYLLPPKLKSLVLNYNSSLAHLYPTDFDTDFINKHKFWMGIPILPSLEIDLVKYIYIKYQDELTEKEQFRNRLCDNIIFN